MCGVIMFLYAISAILGGHNGSHRPFPNLRFRVWQPLPKPILHLIDCHLLYFIESLVVVVVVGDAKVIRASGMISCTFMFRMIYSTKPVMTPAFSGCLVVWRELNVKAEVNDILGVRH